MKIFRLIIFFLSFLALLNACQTFQEGMTGNKRSKSSDEFLVHKKKPLVVPPDFELIPSPKPLEKKKSQGTVSTENIEDLLNIKKDETTIESTGDDSLKKSILKKIKTN
tara:strand:+ start:1196 stop:1522 length:327 start_codon:yes stop_codon:yes gene_type:complete